MINTTTRRPQPVMSKDSSYIKLYLDKDTHERLLKLTQQEGTSFRTLIRETIHQNYVNLIQKKGTNNVA